MNVDICILLRKTCRDITREYEKFFVGSGIRCTQYNLLLCMQEMAIDSIKEGADLLGMDRTTMSRNMQPLIKRGYISIINSIDHRSKAYMLTDKGFAAIEKGKECMAKAQEFVKNAISCTEYEEIIKRVHYLVKKLADLNY